MNSRALLLILFLPAHVVAGDAEAGAKLYYDFACYSCHGYNGTGRVPLANDASGVMVNEQVYLNYMRLRADQNPVNPSNSMPNYDVSTLSDEQALDLYAYIKTLRDDPPEIDEDPVMREVLESANQMRDENI